MGSSVFRRISAIASSSVMAAFAFTGMVSAQSASGTITNTGPGSTNVISSTQTNRCTVTNTNNVNVTNSNNQNASTGDATVGALPWTGWEALSPEAAQADGQSYADWWGGVAAWVSARAAGQGWNSPAAASAPASSGEWANWDPLAWQQNGSSFGDWFAGVQGYMNANSPTWLMTWPSGGNTMGGDATTGDATNVNNASFSINIINSAPTDSCGNSVIPVVPPVNPPSGGKGGGGSTWVSPASYSAPRGGGGGGGSYGAYRTPVYSAPRAVVATAAPAPTPAPVPVTPVVPPTPPTPPVAPAASISNTGPGSSNVISSTVNNNVNVTNNNNISVVNTSQQTASSGDATVAGNTGSGGGGSGDAGNANGTGVGAGATN